MIEVTLYEVAPRNAQEALEIEGLAAQLMQQDYEGSAAFWHLVREDAKKRYRERARRQIIESRYGGA